MPEIDDIVSSVSQSKKYRSVDPEMIRRVAEKELTGQGSFKAATKATKRRLHQVYGAFQDFVDYEASVHSLATARGAGSDALRAACRDIMALHSSTHERLPILDRFYPAIWAITGVPHSIVDLGCGLNPLALPWMGLSSPTRYVAVDIDSDRIRFLNRFFALLGLAPLARCQDILGGLPNDSADVALLLKTSPSLERQEAGATLRILQNLDASHIVVSFAIKSLGGREKGMVAHYERQFLSELGDRPWRVSRQVFDSELVFVVQRARAG